MPQAAHRMLRMDGLPIEKPSGSRYRIIPTTGRESLI
jgi:hypothetical protein